ncbi:MAG: hypothetical protein KDH20_14625 [Rhodocyclaceae bacterium]|nr:hypothetical protein [Rhodocyclaceae bacterium]
MREQPRGDALLACARQVLKETVLPALTGDARHAVLMTMNAMSIAERQLRLGDGPEEAELAELRSLLDDGRADLADGTRSLSRLIRAGEADPGRDFRAPVLAHLRAAGLRRLAESNPKALPKTAR